MASLPNRESARTILTTAGLGAAALMLAAAAAVPAFADDHGDGAGSDTHTSQSANGNHYGQTKQHRHNGDQTTGEAKSNGQSDDSESASANPSSHGNGNDATGHNPPGNNGTVFIHDVAGDQNPHNVPHVSCTFYVDFFGFDAGQNVTVSFAGQAPTGKGTALGGTTTVTPVSTDAAGGAGNDFDNELTFTADQLGVSSLGTAAHQGYHVKMTVATNQPDANPTAGHKYKVFWLQPCPAPTAGTAVAPTEADQEAAAAQAGTTGQSSGGAEAANTKAIPTQVLGRQITKSTAGSAAAPAAASLPFTGAEIGGLLAAAAIALGGGAALTLAGRRRRQARSVSSS